MRRCSLPNSRIGTAVLAVLALLTLCALAFTLGYEQRLPAGSNLMRGTNLTTFAGIALLAIFSAWAAAYLLFLRRAGALLELTLHKEAGITPAVKSAPAGDRELGELARPLEALAAGLREMDAEAASGALRSSADPFHALADLLPEGVAICCEGELVFLNDSGARLFGMEPLALGIGQPIPGPVHPGPDGAVYQQISRLASGPQSGSLREEQIVRLDGAALEVEAAAAPTIYAGKSAVLLLIRDISERKQAVLRLQRRAEEMKALYQTSMDLTGQLDLEALLETITERATWLLGAQIGGVYLVSEDGLSLRLAAHRNFPQERIGVTLKIGEGASGAAAQRGDPVQIEDLQADQGRSAVYEGISLGRVLALPMKVRERVMGVITVSDPARTGTFDQDQIQMARLFADQAAIAVENARLYRLAQRELDEREQSEETQNRLVAELSALHAVSLAGIAASDLDDLTERVTDIVREQFFPDDFGISYYDEEKGVLRFHPSYQIRNGQTIPNIHPGEGISGWVAQHKQPRRVEDVRLDPDYLVADPDVRSEVCVPILQGESLVGVINAESRQINAFSLADERLLISLASEMSMAIQKLRLLGQERRRRQEAEILRVSTAALTSTLDLDRVLEQLLEYLKQVVPYDSVSVLLTNRDKLEVTAERGFARQKSGAALPDMEDLGYIKEVMDRGRPLIIPDTRNDPRWAAGPDGSFTRCWMGVPLLVRDRVIGIINLDKAEPGYYASEDAELALAFANQAALALENARLYEAELQRSQELEALGAVSDALRAAPTPVEMLPIILDQTMGLLQASAAGIVFFSSEQREARLALGRGLWEPFTDRRFPIEASQVSREVFQSRSPFLSNSTPERADSGSASLFAGTQSVLFAPMIIQERVAGMLGIGRDPAVAGREAHRLSAVAELAANALNRAQLHEQTVQRLKRLTILRKVDMAIAASMDARFTLDILLEEMVGSLKLDAADVLFFNPALYTLDWAAGRGFDNMSIHHARASLPPLSALDPEIPLARAIIGRQPVIINDLGAVNVERLHLLAEDGYRSFMVLPLVSKGEVKGLLEIFQRSALPQDREWIDFVESLAGQAAISLDNAELFGDLQRSNMELSLAYDATIEGWARALDMRNEETERHSYRVVEKTIELARLMGVGEAQLVHIRRGAFLHDIGKIAIPDSILLKQGPLGEEEWEIMRKHPVFAYELLLPITYLNPAIDIPYCHHEKWNGTGYPRGLKGEEIPLSARIFAIVDVWDALLHDRPYRPPWPEAKARAYLAEQSGSHFDPRVVEAFFTLQGWI